MKPWYNMSVGKLEGRYVEKITPLEQKQGYSGAHRTVTR